MSVYSNKAHNKWDEPASSALALCLLASSSGLGTGLPPKDSAPPLDALRPRFVQAALLGYVLPIAKAVLLPGFFSAKLGNLPFSERLYPGTKRKRGGRPSTRSQGSGWSLTRAIQETIQSKASKKKQKDSPQGIHHEGKCSSGSYQFKGKTG